MTLDAPLFTANRGAQVNLSAAYVAVGNYINNSDYYDTGDGSPNAAAVLAPVPGNATLSINAHLIDVRGISGWSGFARENLTSTGDIRFVNGQNEIITPPSIGVPGSPGFEGAFDTSAALNLDGAQLYPTTATAFAINDLPAAAVSGGPSTVVPTVVTIGSSLPHGSAAPATPLSAGGSLAINATEIDQGGVVRAPVGQIALNGVPISGAQGDITTAGTVTLESGSLTSVSANGLLIPYGATSNGTQWTYTNAAGFTEILTQPPAKQISLDGTSVHIGNGAKLDLSGGGDLYAYEFIAGEGGSVDVLNPASLPASAHPSTTAVYTYAILPTLGSAYAPVDPQYDLGSPVATGQTITLSGVPGLAAGTYALLPARYALLPGAYAIQVLQPNSALAPGSSVVQPGGAYVVSARFGIAGTDTLSSLTSSVLVASEGVVRSESQYTDSYANTFFSSAASASGTVAPRLPADSGQLLLSVTDALTLNGSINFASGSLVSGTSASGAPITQQGLGGDVAITAQNIEVVDAAVAQAPAPAGVVQLNVQQLDNLDAQTLILGASSSTVTAGEQLNLATTRTVQLKNTTALRAPEIILAAQDTVSVDPGAAISATGSPGQVPNDTLLLPGGGAILRVSNGSADTLTVASSSISGNPTRTISIGAGSKVDAGGSLLLYGTNNTTLAPSAQVAAPSVGLYSSAVSLGEVPTGTPGLALTSQMLAGLKGLTQLTIGSSSTIDFYGPVQLGSTSSGASGLNSITLDAAALGGYGSGNKSLEAGSITWTNSSANSANFSSAPDGTGSLQLIASASAATAGSAPDHALGAGDKTISGFSALDLRAGGDVVGQGVGALTVASNAAVPLSVTSAAVIGGAGRIRP